MSEYTNSYIKFKEVTGYDIQQFFSDFVNFVNTDYPYIIDYYGSGNINQAAFYELERLLRETENIEPLFSLHKNNLDDIGMWYLLDAFSDISTKLATTRMASKWTRSIYNAVRASAIKMEKVLSPGQTFEEIAEDLEAADPQNDWLNIVTPQYIREEDYTVENGSRIFSVNLQNIRLNYVDNVVDTLSGKNILGKDLSTDFIFEGDDLKTVQYEDSIFQALDLITKSVQGCIPEFPEYGIPSDFIGTTINAFQYPVVFKAIMNMFQRDSRWKTVELLEVERKEDAIFLKLKATAVTENSYITNVPI
jgi:hypothetical protein